MMHQVHFEDDRNLGRHVLVSSRFTQKDERGGQPERLTLRKSKAVDRGLRVHGFVIGYFWVVLNL